MSGHVSIWMRYTLESWRTISMPQVNCRPMSEKVSKAMRTASLEPLIEDVPFHWEAEGISKRSALN